MIKKIFFLFCFTTTLSWIASSQTVVFINAGSRAAWGNQQQMLIDASGNVRYHLREVNGPAKDSSFFKLTPQQLSSFFEKAESSGFFSLEKEYKGMSADGAGIYISLNSPNKKHAVGLVNTDVTAINELIAFLNTMLEPQKIRINYGQFVQDKRG